VLDAVGTNGNNIYNVRTHLMNGQPVVGNDTKASLSLWEGLTADDWAVVSAAVGHQCGPDENGNMEAGQPQLAVQLAYDRQSGRLQGPLTSSYLKPDLAGQDSQYAAQLTNAIDYLEKREKMLPPGDPRRRTIDTTA
jgi:hypothetical protein